MIGLWSIEEIKAKDIVQEEGLDALAVLHDAVMTDPRPGTMVLRDALSHMGGSNSFYLHVMQGQSTVRCDDGHSFSVSFDDFSTPSATLRACINAFALAVPKGLGQSGLTLILRAVLTGIAARAVPDERFKAIKGSSIAPQLAASVFELCEALGGAADYMLLKGALMQAFPRKDRRSPVVGSGVGRVIGSMVRAGLLRKGTSHWVGMPSAVVISRPRPNDDDTQGVLALDIERDVLVRRVKSREEGAQVTTWITQG